MDTLLTTDIIILLSLMNAIILATLAAALQHQHAQAVISIPPIAFFYLVSAFKHVQRDTMILLANVFSATQTAQNVVKAQRIVLSAQLGCIIKGELVLVLVPIISTFKIVFQ